MKLLSCLLLSSILQAAADDPSLRPHQNPTDGATQKYSERLRILTDLDGDGVDDIVTEIKIGKNQVVKGFKANGKDFGGFETNVDD